MNFQLFRFDYIGLYISIGLIIILLFLYFFKLRLYPSFVVPYKLIKQKYYFLEKALFGFIVIILIIIPFNIQYRGDKKYTSSKTSNVQILFDVSLSMTADDITPSRFDAAKESVISLVNNLQDYNISMITFSGIPFVWMPYSNDTYSMKQKLSKMVHSDFPPADSFVGTAIGDAILLGIDNLLNNSKDESNPGLIILLTDGDSNRGSRPHQASLIAKNKNIPIYVLGIGNSDYLVGKDYFDNDVTTTINIPLLESIATNSGGKFYRVLKQQDFMFIFSEIEQLIKSKEIPQIYYDYISLNKILIIILIILGILLLFEKLFIFYNLYNKKY